MEKKRFCLLVNPNAGYGRALHVLRKVERTLDTLPINYHTEITTSIDHAQSLAKEAIQNDENIAILGGDGTARSIAHVLKENQGTLGLIPAGRGNDIFRVLNIPLDPIEACKTLAYGKEVKMDIGCVNNQPFLGICSLGFDSIATPLANSARFIRNRIVYLYAGLRVLCKWQPIQFNVEIDGKRFTHLGYTVAVANSNTYGGGMQLAPKASVHDGLLDVVLIGKIPKFRMLVNVPRIFKGTHIHEPGFQILQGRHIKISADSQYGIYADGDFIAAPPADIHIMPHTLRLLVP